MSERKRLFFAVNLPQSVKEWVGKELLPLLPRDGLKKVVQENLHVTLQFLGYFPIEAVKELAQNVDSVKRLECFEAELNCVGHFKGKVIWLGFGRGTEQFNLLSRKMQAALGTHDERFHAHVTLARNRGLPRGQVQSLVEKLRQKMQTKKFEVKSFELMESRLRKSGPEYGIVFSKRLSQKELEATRNA